MLPYHRSFLITDRRYALYLKQSERFFFCDSVDIELTMDLGDVNISKPRKSITAIKDSKYLLSASSKNEEYPNALEYTIYGFIREFIESNVRVEWEQIIPNVIKKVVSMYMKSELIIKPNTKTTLISGVYHEFVSIAIGKGGCLTVEPWNSRTKKGGKLLIRVDKDIRIEEEGQINVNGKGFCGGYFCEQGESFNGKGQKNVIENNCGGGGAGVGKKSNGYSQCRGAGGGYGTKGNDIRRSRSSKRFSMGAKPSTKVNFRFLFPKFLFMILYTL